MMKMTFVFHRNYDAVFARGTSSESCNFLSGKFCVTEQRFTSAVNSGAGLWRGIGAEASSVYR
jgi:hypothetical protein